ncbi:MAG: hypothetical protein QM578_19050 [Pantoea sp.]|uniref:hypothetical protein n=1 Tax=Pantoea sp. TaxID=69393 RepID=UPI0039E72502
MTIGALVLISLMLWSYVLCRSIDYFFPADARERQHHTVRLRQAGLTAMMVTLATLLLLLSG